MQISVVALLFLLFSCLFCIMAFMDLNRLEEMLLNFRINRAQDIVTGMENAAEKKIAALNRMGLKGGLRQGESEAATSLQEAFVRILIGVAQELDRRDQADGLTADRLSEFAASRNFLAIAVFDGKGVPRVQTGPIPGFLIPRVAPLVAGSEKTAVHFFENAGVPEPLGFVGINRESQGGAIILLLDARGLQHWRSDVAIWKATEELSSMRGVTYISVDDNSGRRIARVGIAPDDTSSDPAPAGVNRKETVGINGRKITETGSHSSQFELPFKLQGVTFGIARVGLDRPADWYLVEERRHILLWTGLMILIGFLAMGFFYRNQNSHISRLQAVREKLKHAERLSALGRLAAGVAHEIRNPLNAISMATQRIEKQFAPTESRQEFERITFIVRDEIKRLNAIVEDFLSLSRANRLELSPHSINDILERTLFLIRDEAEEKGIRIETNLADYRVLVDGRKIQQAILNILRNAVESISGPGCIRVSVGNPKKDTVSIEVLDSGIGIPQEELDRIFDPFYTTKEDGTGIGLCIAHEIVVAHGGEILVHSDPGKGTIVEILLSLKTGKSDRRSD